MQEIKLKVKSSYTVIRATCLGAVVGFIVFLVHAGSLAFQTFLTYVLSSILISNVVWKTLGLVDIKMAPRLKGTTLTALLVKYALLCFGLGTLATLFALYVSGLLLRVQPFSDLKSVFLYISIVMLLATLVSSINFALAFYKEALEVHDARRLAVKAELKVLRAQINPHFLFNSLNSIVQLVRVDPEKAEAMTLNLSHVFRYALQALDHETVSLTQELEFLRAYLAIEQVRFEDGLTVIMDIPEESLQIRILPVILQPLVENSIKHGITPQRELGRIEVSGSIEGSRLNLTVRDNGVGFDVDKAVGTEATGIGLKNVQDRLTLAFGLESRLHIESWPGEGTSISFQIPATLDRKAAAGLPLKEFSLRVNLPEDRNRLT